MSWISRLFSVGKDRVQHTEMVELLTKQTGDPAYLHRTNWITAYGRKDYKAALAQLEKALELVPNSAIYLSLRGMTHWTMGNRRAAYADYSAARCSNPTQKEVNDLQDILRADARECRDNARAAAKVGKLEEALGLLNKALDVEPDKGETLFFRGLLQSKLGNTSAAITDVSRALELDPKCGDGQGVTGREVLQSLKNMAPKQAA